MELCIVKNGTKISKRKNSFNVDDKEKELLLSAEKIDSIILEGEALITSGAIRLAIENEIPLVISDKYGNIIGQFFKSTGDKNGKLRKKQYNYFSNDEALEIAKGWIIEKIIKQKEHLEKLLRRRRKTIESLCILKSYIEKIERIKNNNEASRLVIMGFEGMASRKYFETISELLDKKWQFKRREHRNAKEPYNIVLNYLFGILYRKLESSFLYEGFDLTTGIIHFEGDRKLPLIYDFIEKYRYLGYEAAFDLFNNRVIKEDFFEIEEEKVILSRKGKYEISLYFNEVLQKRELYSKNKFTIEDLIKFEIKNFKRNILEVVA